MDFSPQTLEICDYIGLMLEQHFVSGTAFTLGAPSILPGGMQTYWTDPTTQSQVANYMLAAGWNVTWQGNALRILGREHGENPLTSIIGPGNQDS